MKEWWLICMAPSHYLNQCWVIVNWTLRNKLQWNFNQHTKFSNHENASENIVCEMVAILSRGDELTFVFVSKINKPAYKASLSAYICFFQYIEGETNWLPVCRQHFPLQWRHNGLDGVSNHQPHHCLLSRLVGRRSKKTSKLRVTGLCAGNSPGTGEFPAQMASYAKNVSIWWRHHAYACSWQKTFVFWFKFRFLRVQLLICYHWFRWWLGARQVTNLYLNQWKIKFASLNLVGLKTIKAWIYTDLWDKERSTSQLELCKHDCKHNNSQQMQAMLARLSQFKSFLLFSSTQKYMFVWSDKKQQPCSWSVEVFLSFTKMDK